MDFSRLEGFEWDEGNLKKVLQRMEAGIAEVAFQGEPWVAQSGQFSGGEKRWFLINQVMRRYVFIVFTIHGNKIRIVSARYMHHREVKYYERKFKEKEKDNGK